MKVFESALETPPQVICIGEALVDRLGGIGKDLSLDDEFQDCLGGAPANVACALGRLGVDVAFLGCLGDDWILNDFQKVLIDRKVNISGLQVDNKRPSRVVLVSRDSKGDRSFGGFYGDSGDGFADQAIALSGIRDHWDLLARDSKWLVLGTIPLASKISSDSIFWTVEKAIKSKIKIALDVNWRPTFWDSALNSDQGPNRLAFAAIKPLFEVASLLKLTKEEAIWFFDTNDPAAISSSLPQSPDVVITNGNEPIRWKLSSFIGECLAFTDQSVVDTTGAGDAFTAGLIHQLLRLNNIVNSKSKAEEVIRFSNACGAIVCSGAGAIDPQPNNSEVLQFLSSSNGGCN